MNAECHKQIHLVIVEDSVKHLLSRLWLLYIVGYSKWKWVIFLLLHYHTIVTALQHKKGLVADSKCFLKMPCHNLGHCSTPTMHCLPLSR